MLKNAYLLAKIGADTAENDRNFAKNWQLSYGALPSPSRRRERVAGGSGDALGDLQGVEGAWSGIPRYSRAKDNPFEVSSNYGALRRWHSKGAWSISAGISRLSRFTSGHAHSNEEDDAIVDFFELSSTSEVLSSGGRTL